MRKPTLFAICKNGIKSNAALLCCILFMFPIILQAGLKTSTLNFNGEEECVEASLLFTETDSYRSITLLDNECCGNATTPDDGQFVATLEIIGLSNTTWYVDFANGYYFVGDYDCVNDPWQEPEEFEFGPMGNGIFIEDTNTGIPDTSLYTLQVLLVDKELNQIRLRSSRGDILQLVGQSPKYLEPIISGPISLCESGTGNYEVDGNFANIDWEIIPPEAGTIIGDAKSATVEVEWTSEPGTYQLQFSGTEPNSDCYAPTLIDVVIGGNVTNTMKCHGHQNLSLGGSCELKITPEMILTSGNFEDAPYAVKIKDGKGGFLPNATFTYEHVGQTFDVLVIDGCSMNECHSTITVEDKFKPIIDCSEDPIILACNKVDQYTGPFAMDNCDVNLAVNLIDSSVTLLDCDPLYTARIVKSYQAVDAWGNKSDICPQEILVQRINLEDVIPPESFLMVDGNGLNCDEYMDPPAPLEGGGVPTYNGEPIYPNKEGGLCNTAVTYSDRDAGTIGCTRKVVRTWKIFEWYCNETIDTTFQQMFEITDTTPPDILSQIPDITISASSGSCQASYFVIPISAEDNCNTVESITVDGKDATSGFLTLLDEGDNEIKYYVADECGNEDSLSHIVTVIDKTAPTVICDLITTVGLDINGDAYVPASVFNNLSHDACGIDKIEVRRMQDTDVTCIEISESFSEYVEFCCDDAGKIRMVEMRVTDVNGNSNTCMVEVEVQDKFAPNITAPEDMTISCEEDLDLDNLPDTGRPTIDDACPVQLDSLIVADIDNMCRTGKIYKIWIASDANGEDRDTQIISVLNLDPFDIDEDDWPEDFETDALCGDDDVEPENLPAGYDRPDLDIGACDNVTVTKTDEIYPFSDGDGGCFKILRTWVVLDWCQEGRDGRARRWTHEQVIKIRNNDKPIITTDLLPQEECSDNCDGGVIAFGVSAFDTCTAGPDLRWEYSIDFFDDNTIDSMANGSGDTAFIDGMFAIGNHRILWTFRDGCGNSTTESQLFTIKDCNGPVASAIDGFAIGLTPMNLTGDDNIPDDEQACIFADSVNASSYHPCDVPITFSFSTDTTDKKITFDCFDIGTNTIFLFVTDIFGNVDSVSFEVDVQDNNDVEICDDPRRCIVYPPDTTVTACDPDLDPSSLGMPLIDGDCSCDDFTISFSDDTLSYPNDDCLLIRRWHTVEFNCGRNPILSNQVQEIRILNVLPPTIICPGNIEVDAPANACEAAIDIAMATASGSCNSGIVITNDFNSGGADASDTYPVGTTPVQFVAVDDCGNADTCVIMVTVNDVSGPFCNTNDDVTVTLNEMGMFTLTSELLDGGSADACGGIDTFIVSPTKVDCSDIGIPVVVDITITDDAGNETLCSTTVEVRDTIKPVCDVQDITVQITTEMEEVIVMPDEIDVASFDTCGMIVSRELTRDTIRCEDVGTTVNTQLILTDNSGNTSVCDASIIVEDKVPPVCQPKDITVTIAGNNEVTILPDSIDNGSFDPCGIGGLTFETSDSTFDCSDINTTQVIDFIVTDAAGNVSSCSANVFIEDRTEIECVAADITVYLDDMGMASITAEDIGSGSSAGCNNEVRLDIDKMDFNCDSIALSPITVTLTVSADGLTSKECTALVTVLDTLPPMGEVMAMNLRCFEFSGNMGDVGGLTVTENCEVASIDTMIVNDQLNECGIGTLVRRFIITDVNSNVDTTEEQLITILNEFDPFNEDDITFPPVDVVVDGCGAALDPASLMSQTTINTSGDTCSSVTIQNFDTFLSDNMGCGDTLQRVWVVTDACQLNNAMPEAGIWRDTQLIIINDMTPPVVIGPQDTITIENANSTSDCAVTVMLMPISATDDCTMDEDIIIRHDSENAFDPMSNDVSGDYDPGEYKIIYEAEDKCGNIAMDSFVLVVEEPSGNGLPCIKVFADIEANLTVTVTPESFGVTSATTCFDPMGLTFSFNRDDQTDDEITYNCSDVGQVSPGNPLGYNVPLYAFDAMGVIVDSCINTVTVVDFSGRCQNFTGVNGAINTANNEEVQGVRVKLSGDLDIETETGANGTFTFNDLDPGINVMVSPYKNDDVLNGVSTLDLIIIQRHILGLHSFDSEYLMVAADINNDMKLTALDLIALRKTILGIESEFPGNTSWRMVEKAYDFPEKDNPFAEYWPETYEINNLISAMKVDFIGVKIGDVDGDVIANSRQRNTTRNAGVVTLEKIHRNGNLDFVASDDLDMIGMQLSGKLFGRDLDVSSSLPMFNASNYVMDSDGNLVLSWNADKAIKVRKGETIFSVSGAINPNISLDRSFNSQLYQMQNGEIQAFEFDFSETEILLGGLEIQQNKPNPWSTFTDIAFSLGYDDEVKINIYDAQGKLLKVKFMNAVQGNNVMRVYRDDVPASGLLFFDVISSKEKKNGRMILIK